MHPAPDAISSARFYSRSHDFAIRILRRSGNVIEKHENADEFKAC
jgi:hypothetical protein